MKINTIIITVLVLSTSSLAAIFEGLGLSGSVHPTLLSVSGDGTTVAGTVNNRAFRWTANTGVVLLDSRLSSANAVSEDGSVITGRISENGDAGAALWSEDTGVVILGVTRGTPFEPTSISANGTRVVGSRILGAPPSDPAWVWSEGSGGITDLPLIDSSRAFAAGISADGTIVAGSATPFFGGVSNAVIWIDQGNGNFSNEIVISSVLPISFAVSSTDISADGTTVVGRISSSTSSDSVFRWTSATGFLDLELPGISSSGVSGDGSIIVGADSNSGTAMIWDEVNGVRNLQNLLANEFGLENDLAGWTLEGANGISDDGNVIVGLGINPLGARDVWVVVLPEPTTLVFTISGLVLVVSSRRCWRTAQ